MPQRSLTQAVMPLGEHLEELRRRLIIALIGILPVMVVGLVIAIPMMEFIIDPLRGALTMQGQPPQLQAISPTETFNVYLKIAIVFTVIVGSPWILYQLWLFVAPGLYEQEQRFVYLLAPMSLLLSIASLVFVYYILLPVILSFFVGFGASFTPPRVPTAEPPAGTTFLHVPVLDADPPKPNVGDVWFNKHAQQMRIAVSVDKAGHVRTLGTPLMTNSLIAQQYRVSDYVKLVLNLALAFALSFQMPIVVLLLGWAGILDPDVLKKYRRHAIIILCIISAIVTPADPLSMILMAAPLYLLYELGLLLVRVVTPERVAAGFRRRPRDGGGPNDDEGP